MKFVKFVEIQNRRMYRQATVTSRCEQASWYFQIQNCETLKWFQTIAISNYNQGAESLLLPLREGADKSLARPGSKQATATKFGIYSTYSPRRSIHFLVRCSNFCKPLKKKIQKVVRPSRSPRQQWLPCRTKNGDHLIAFSVQGTGGRTTGPDPENRVGDQDIGSPGRPVSSALQVSGEPGHCRARTRPSWCPYRGVRFPFKISFNCTSRDE